ncbi:major facilitator superfamily domain-containing protein, partial [Obelidium mucronatum]
MVEAQGQEVALSPFRFAVAVGVFFANFNNALLWSTYAAVSPSAARFYNCSEFTINMVALVFQIVFIPFAYPAIYVLDTYGLRVSVLIGTWGVTLGGLVRWLGSILGPPETQVPFLFIGQTIAAIATPFAFNAPTKACAAWFGENERLTANTVMSLSIYGGTALALAIGPALVNSDPQNMNTLNLATFAIVFSTGLTSLLVFDKPAIAPSKSAQVDSLPFLHGLKQAVMNPQFIVIVAAYGMTAGSLDTYFTLISDYVTPFGYSEADSGIIGIITIISGVISSLLLGAILDRTKLHRLFLKLLTVVSFLGSLGFYFSASFTDRRVLLFASAAVTGIGGFALAPIALELGVECTYPVGEGTSAGLIQTAGQFFGVVVLLVSNALRASDGSLSDAMIWRIGVCGVVMLIVPLYTANNRRIDLETEQAQS